MKAFLSILQILLSVGLMGVILLQHRKTGGFSGMFGGGARNPAWTRIRAARLGVPVLVADQTEAAYGTALLALAGGPPS